MRRSILLLIALVVWFARGHAAAQGSAGQISVPLKEGLTIDGVGADLRRAISAYEHAAANEPPQKWMIASLAPNRSQAICGNVYLLLQSGSAFETTLLVVDDAGPHQTTFRAGDEKVVGPLRLILLPSAGGRSGTQFLVKAAQAAPLLMEGGNSSTSRTKIEGTEPPPAVKVVSSDARALDFAEAFLAYRNAGASAEDAASQARDDVPPPSRLEGGGAIVLPERIVAQEPTDGIPLSAMVTLRLVRGEASSLRELSGKLSYDSAGRGNDDPRARAGSGPGGGTIAVGDPGDRFRGAMRAYEGGGKLHVDNETMIRVPIGGVSTFRFDGPSGGVNGAMHVRQVGARQVEVSIDQEGGDWSFLGAVSTRIRLRDGQTLPVAQSTTSRTSSSSSGTPILSGIPYVGPAFGSSSSSSQNSSYALFATVVLD